MAYFLILLAIILRFLPHPPNFAPVAAVALFGGTYLNKKYSLAVPLMAMLLSDYFLGFYSWPIMATVYASFALSGILGWWVKKHKTPLNIAGVTLLGSVQFFLLTNAAVWAFGTMYPHSLAGLLMSYVNGLPFFRNTLLGDVFYVGVLFGSYELIKVFTSTRALQRAR